jgi:hypothetical protein
MPFGGAYRMSGFGTGFGKYHSNDAYLKQHSNQFK